MSSKQLLERVELENARAVSARRALAARVEPLERLSGHVHPLVLAGSALLAGLVAGRLLGRPRLPRALEPAALISSALQKSLVGALETLFSAALTPPAAAPPPGPEEPGAS